MAQKPILTAWDRDNRNNMESNFTELYGDVGNITGKITDEIYSEIRNDVKLNWREPVDMFEDLPEEAETGDTRMVREKTDDDVSPVYRYSGSEWIRVQEIDSTVITEVDERLQSEINKKETPEGSQSKVDVAIEETKDYTDALDEKVFGDASAIEKVVEMGSNDKGSYIRWSSGKQECWGMNVSQATSNTSGTIFSSDAGRVEYPLSFDSTHPIHVDAHVKSLGKWANAAIPQSTYVNVYQYGTVRTDTTFTTSVRAVGRWK